MKVIVFRCLCFFFIKGTYTQKPWKHLSYAGVMEVLFMTVPITRSHMCRGVTQRFLSSPYNHLSNPLENCQCLACTLSLSETKLPLWQELLNVFRTG